MNKEILVTGGRGYIMSSISEDLQSNGIDIVAPSKEALDVTNLNQVREFIKKSKCKVFVHAGAYTKVPDARKEFHLAKKINGEGTKNVAIACEEAGIRMVLVSTDYIFPGTMRNPGPYDENARRPESFTSIELGAYGSTKLLSEILAQKYCSKLSIIRLSYPFGCWGKKDYAAKLVETAANGFGLFSDQINTPAYLPDFSLALRKIISCDVDGIFHVGCIIPTNPYEMGKYVIEKLNLQLPIIEGSCTNHLKDPNKDMIPQYGGLATVKTREKLNIQFHFWQEAVDKYLRDV